MNTDYKALCLKLEKVCKKNKAMKLLSLHMQFLKRYRGSENLKTTGGKITNEPYTLCKISITPEEQIYDVEDEAFLTKSGLIF